ncbi:hypothetical protein M8C21_022621, partial [Ambrosia artemisiifolia]
FIITDQRTMKLSLKLEDHQENQTPILFKAKIPITVFGLPFISAVSTTHNHHHNNNNDNLSLSLRTHFPSGPSLKLSYTTPTTITTTTTTTAPFTLTLKSGVSLSGSPINSPLIISANFSFSPHNPNPNPNFSIKFTPRLGSFSIRKSIHSNSVSDSSNKVNGEGNSDGFVPLDRLINRKELGMGSVDKGSILKGIMMAADTELPVMKRVKVNLRWGVYVPSVPSVPSNLDYTKQLPYLRVNKIKVERIEDVVEERVGRERGVDGEFEMLKGMYSWMSNEVKDLQKENREMRRALEDVKLQKPLTNHNGHNGSGKRAVLPSVEISDGFEQWKMKKKNGGGVEANAQRETKKNGGSADVESLLCLWASERVVEVVDRYDDVCLPKSYSTNPDLFIQSKNTNKTCVRTLKVPRKMTAPIFIYYQLDNFYQNHRRYVNSRSEKQLRDPDEADETDDCKPINNLNGNEDAPIVPCGLVAWSLFNDTYKFFKGNKAIDIDKKGIAWKSDKNYKFGSNVYPKNFQKGELIGGGALDESKPLSEQEGLIVWMKTAALPTFRKLYGKIHTDLEANETITVVIQNNYNTYVFGGEKKVALSTANWIGGKNDFFGVAFLTVGGVCIFVAIIFIFLYVLKPRPLGDPAYLSWNRNQGSQ